MEFEERIAYMENIIKAYRWESSAEILIYLRLYGPLSANQLKELLDMRGAKSIFKPLRVLSDTGFITKINGKPARYKLTGKSVIDPSFDREFLQYLVDKNKFNLLRNYLQVTSRSSMSFLNAVGRVIEARIMNSNDLDAATEFTEDSLFFESMLSLPDPKVLGEKLREFLRDEVLQHRENLFDGGNPLSNPAALYVAFMPIPEGNEH